MCIRDRIQFALDPATTELFEEAKKKGKTGYCFFKSAPDKICLLYTSDAADERSSVDLGGRRIIKKKNK